MNNINQTKQCFISCLFAAGGIRRFGIIIRCNNLCFPDRPLQNHIPVFARHNLLHADLVLGYTGDRHLPGRVDNCARWFRPRSELSLGLPRLDRDGRNSVCGHRQHIPRRWKKLKCLYPFFNICDLSSAVYSLCTSISHSYPLKATLLLTDKISNMQDAL